MVMSAFSKSYKAKASVLREMQFLSRNEETIEVQSLGNSLKSVLGNTECLKCIVDEDQYIFANCTAFLLQNLDITHISCHLLNSAVQRHHDIYRSNTATLAYLIFRLQEMGRQLIDKGIPVADIVSGMQAGIQTCIDNLQPISIATVMSDIPVSKNPGNSVGRICQEISKFSSRESPQFFSCPADIDDQQFTLSSGCQTVPNDEVNDLCSSNKAESVTEHIDFIIGDPNPALKGELWVSNYEDHGHKVQTGEYGSTTPAVDDDISWFFDDGVVPSPPEFDGSAADALSQMSSMFKQSLSSETTILNTKNVTVSHRSCDTDINSLDVDEDRTLHGVDCNVSLADTLKGGIKTNVHQTKHCDTSSQEILSHVRSNIKHIYQLPVISNSSLCDNGTVDEDEFDSCFDGIDYVENSTVCSDNNSNSDLTLCSMREQLRDVEINSQHNCTSGHAITSFHNSFLNDSQYATTSLMSESTGDPVVSQETTRNGEDLEEKLRNIMANKSTAINGRVMNASRHFKTIDTTVDQLKESSCESEVSFEIGNVNLEPLHSKPTHSEQTLDIEHKLRDMMTNKRPTCSRAVGNNSRHFKTIKSTVDALNDSRYGEAKSNNHHIQNIVPHEPSLSVDVSSTTPPKEAPHCVRDVGSRSPAAHMARLHTYVHNASQDSAYQNELNERTKKEDGVAYSGLRRLVSSVCHDPWVRPLVLEMVWMQCQTQSLANLRLTLSQVHTLPVVGPCWESSQVVAGLVVRATEEQLELIDTKKGKKCRLLLVNGDLSPTFRHQGHNATKGVHVVTSEPSAQSPRQVWCQEVIDLILQMQVDVVLVRGTIEPMLIDSCLGHQVALLSNIPVPVLLAVGESSQVDLLTYITDAIKEDVCEGVMVHTLTTGLGVSRGKQASHGFIVLSTQENLMQVLRGLFHQQSIQSMSAPCLQMPWCLHRQDISRHNVDNTAILCHPSECMTQVREDRLWHEMYRVAHVLEDGGVLAGNGTTESAAASHLMQHAGELEVTARGCFIAEIYTALSDMFREYASQVASNHGCSACTSLDCGSSVDDMNASGDAECGSYHSLDKKGMVQPEVCFETRMHSEAEMSAESLGSHPWNEAVSNHACYDCPQLYDDSRSKVEAWKTAVHIAGMLLQADLEIITGLTEGSQM